MTAFGHQVFVGSGEESVYGTPVTPGSYYQVEDESFALEQSVMGKPVLNDISQRTAVKSRVNVAGGMTIQLGNQGAGHLFKHAMGAEAISSGTNTYSLAETLPTGLSFTVNRDADALGGDYAFRYTGCQVTSLTLTAEVEEPVKLAVEVIGKDSALVAKPTPTYPTSTIYEWEDLKTFTVFGGARNVRRFELNIENALADDRFNLGDRTRVGLGRNGPRVVTGSFDIEFDSTTIADYNYFKTLASTSLTVFFHQADNKWLKIYLPNIYVQGDEPVTNDAGVIVWTVNFEAFRNAVAGDELQLTSVASY